MQVQELRISFPNGPLIDDFILNFSTCNTHLARNFIFDVFTSFRLAYPSSFDRGQETVFIVHGAHPCASSTSIKEQCATHNAKHKTLNAIERTNLRL